MKNIEKELLPGQDDDLIALGISPDASFFSPFFDQAQERIINTVLVRVQDVVKKFKGIPLYVNIQGNGLVYDENGYIEGLGNGFYLAKIEFDLMSNLAIMEVVG